MKVLVLLADGFEEIEAVTIIDVLRRAQITVHTAYTGTNPVTGAHGITVSSERNIDEISFSEYGCIILPGGMPGSENLKQDDRVISLVKMIHENCGYVAAICAAPIVLGRAGLLRGKKVTCYPGFEGELAGAEVIDEPAVQDGPIITGKGPGCAIPFALKLVEILSGPETAQGLKENMQVYWM